VPFPPGTRNPTTGRPLQPEEPCGDTVAQLEILVPTAVIKSANHLVGWLLQQAADRIDAAYQPKLGEARKGRQTIQGKGLFGCLPLARGY